MQIQWQRRNLFANYLYCKGSHVVFCLLFYNHPFPSKIRVVGAVGGGGDSPLPPSPILGRSVNPISTRMLIMPNTLLEVSRSRNKIVEPKLLSKIKRMNLFFYPDDSEILETWNQNSSFNYFRQDRKTNLSICFLEEVTAQQFCFEIYWPLRAPPDFHTFLRPCKWTQEHESSIWLYQVISFFLVCSWENRFPWEWWITFAAKLILYKRIFGTWQVQFLVNQTI